MEAIIGVWLTSLVGAGAFSTAGYVLGQRGVVLPFLGMKEPARSPERPLAAASPDPEAEGDRPTPEVAPSAKAAKAVKNEEDAAKAVTNEEDDVKVASAKVRLEADEPGDEDDNEEDRPTLVPDKLEHAAALAATLATIPPPRAPALSVGLASGASRSNSDDILAAFAQAEGAERRARAAEGARSELERHLATARSDLGREIVARATAEAHAEELADRLVRASEEASSLRHRVGVLDKQARQLRESLQGRVRALTTSEWHRRRDLEEAENARVKLRDVFDKIERTSTPPGASAPNEVATIPPPPSTSHPPGAAASPELPKHRTWPGMPAVTPTAPPTEDGPPSSAGHLRRLDDEVRRLTEENRSLRKRAFGSLPPRTPPSGGSITDLDLERYRHLIARVGAVSGLRCAVVADEVGSVLVGSGELAEALAAFGSYIKDASARTDGLLPLEGVEEVDIRDRGGMLLSTRVVSHASAELCVVVLGPAGASLDAKKIVEETLRHA